MEAVTTQAPRALTMQFFRRTQEGTELIDKQIPFCIGGSLYQGYKGIPIPVDENTLSDTEFENVYDADGTMARQRKIRSDRMASREARKAKELAERDARRRAELRDELELRKLAQEQGVDLNHLRKIDAGIRGVEPTPDPVPEIEEATVPEPEPTPKLELFRCEECGEVFDSPRKRQGHIMGKHKQKRKE